MNVKIPPPSPAILCVKNNLRIPSLSLWRIKNCCTIFKVTCLNLPCAANFTIDSCRPGRLNTTAASKSSFQVACDVTSSGISDASFPEMDPEAIIGTSVVTIKVGAIAHNITAQLLSLFPCFHRALAASVADGIADCSHL